MFAVVRHPEAGMGICPAEAIDQHRANGWIRVSEYRAEPSDFHLPDFAASAADLDAEPVAAPDPEPAPPAKTTKENKA